ncbi:MAG: sugar kinase [Actinomycetia bacterium]|nr:sugar kinase [Actinomycetes bacterium]
MTRVLSVGEALVLLQPAERGRIETVRRFEARVAGAESNVAIGLARLGIPVAFAGAVGGDPFGTFIRHTLAGEGVDISRIEVRPEPTGIFFKEWFGLGEDPNVYYYRHQSAGSAWSPAVPPEALLEGIGWLHTSGITLMVGERTRHTTEALIQAARARGLVISLDINLRRKLAPPDAWRAVLAPLVQVCDVLLASRDELEAVFGSADPDRLRAAGWLAPGRALVVKEGERGAWMTVDGERTAAPAFSVRRVVDLVGAGDGFAAGLIAARLKGWDWPRALGLANLVGAFAVAHPGDWEGYPTWDECERVLAANWVDR